MKFMLVTLFCAVGLCAALPAQPAQTSVLDLLKDLEDVVEEDGKLLLSKVINVIHHVEDTVLKVKDMVPTAYEKIHEEVDELLKGLKKVADEVQELLGSKNKNVYYGFDLLGGLNELTGGTKLSTVLELLSLADKAHRVMEDAKKFVPHLEDTLKKMQDRVEKHVHDLARDVLKDLGIQDDVAQGVIKKIEDLFEKVEEEGHILILDLLHKMEQTFNILEEQLPEYYKKVQKAVEEVRTKIHNLIAEIEKTLVMRSFNLLDIAGDTTSGTSLGTAFKVMSLLNKFNTVVQDVRNFGPKAEVLLQHSVKKVADSAQVFFSHAADKLLNF
jgi:uncharacterized protein YicC (UPF0701 family)